MSFKKVELYGGAITVDLPAAYGDASQIREVPDHQELYLDENGYTGVIFEILEYVDNLTDAEALQYHFADLVDGTGDSTNMLEQSHATMAKVSNKPVYTLSFIQTPPPPDRPRKTPDFVAILLLLLRLKEQGTDIMVTINIPHYPGEYEKAGAGEKTALMREGDEVAKKVLETFEVRDWGLFQG
ncbi:Mog1p/PsbP-like protein [Bimuria novae-zelandiae CBS 107.79]|uniref:Mog1p/PsbP-like protein n=1 Tax=Bimuria novae-zelandiae CBS 107.79 TaxID=1447943 RepID=A0A6A5VJK4_9PLEO|nr:Mog1p/PsbP-like protein [Bimuria novae-zelandiae CBS 107.79]